MLLKLLFEDVFSVVATTHDGSCSTEAFLNSGEATTKAAREGLYEMLKHVAERGLEGVPAAWVHEANKKESIYEFIKGPLRLFFFKGKDGQVVVCTDGVRKKGKKADRKSVKKAVALRKEYLEAVDNGTLDLVEDDES